MTSASVLRGQSQAIFLGLCGVVSMSGCSESNRELQPTDAILDPETCMECHPDHYREWLGSMHAYAAEDPVFRALNARGQRETNGELGDFCVQCHAPMALELGLTVDGTNLDEIPQQLHGVTCYFCHTVDAVDGTHNNPLVLSGLSVMTAAIRDPVENSAHGSRYSQYADQATLASARACGSCHDVVTPAGVHLERTYAEWLDTFFADVDELSGGPAVYGQRCGSCHMGPPTVRPIADAPNVRADRIYNSHMMPGVDIAITDFPNAELGPQLVTEQRAAIEEQRKSALCATICVNGDSGSGSNVDVWLHNEFSAHGWPSGATHDRRAWLEMLAFSGEEQVFATGVVADNEAVDDLDDPMLWLFHSRIFDAQGKEVHMFWEARSIESNALPASTELSGAADAGTWRARRFPVANAEVDRVTTRVRIRPINRTVLQMLVDSGDLDVRHLDAMETFDVTPTVLEWTAEAATEYPDYGLCVNSSDSCGAPIVGAAFPESSIGGADGE